MRSEGKKSTCHCPSSYGAKSLFVHMYVGLLLSSTHCYVHNFHLLKLLLDSCKDS